MDDRPGVRVGAYAGLLVLVGGVSASLMPVRGSLHCRTGVQSGASRDTREGAIGSCLDMPRAMSPVPARARLAGGLAIGAQLQPEQAGKKNLVHVLPSASESEMSPPERHWTTFSTRNDRILRMCGGQKRRYLRLRFAPDSTPSVCLASNHAL